MISLNKFLIRFKSTYKYTPLNECLNIVKTRDYENYFCTLLINNVDVKRFAIAVRALNAELASITDVSKNQDAANLRFKYWLETISKLSKSDYYPLINEPISSELKRCIERAKLNNILLHWLKKLVISRKNNMSNFPFSTIQEFEIYQEESVSSTYHLLVDYSIKLGCFEKSLSKKSTRLHIDHIANHLGKCQGTVNMLRGLYRNALMEQCLIPNDLLIKYNCTHEDLIRLCYQLQKATTLNKKIQEEELEKYRFKNILELVFELASLSKQNLNTALQIYNKLNLTQKQINYIFMPIYIQHMYLNDLEQNEFNVFDLRLFAKRKRTLPIRLYIKSFEFTRLK